MKKPLVSVLMITYNQEKFIEQALKSVVTQKTKFPFEIVIGDDVSTDKTRDILKRYQRRYPRLIKLILQPKNLKPSKNLMSVYGHCQGTYIALLEGDDYWTSPKKLQKQVDVLEKHPEIAICFHATSMINQQGKEVLLLPLPKFRRQGLGLADLIENESFMATCSTMFRNRLFGSFPAWFKKLTYIADLPLHVLNAEHGGIYYLDEVMSVYRWASSTTAFSAQPSLTTNHEGLVMFEGLLRHFGKRYQSVIRDKMARNYFALAQAHFQQGNVFLAQENYRYYQEYKESHTYISLKDRVIFPLKLALNSLW